MRRCRVYQVRASAAGVVSIVPGAIRLVLLAAIMLVLDSCASHGGATQQVATSSSPDASSPPSAETPGASATSTPSAGRPAVPVSCHVTIPAARFVPPRPFAPQPPAEYHERWYGTTDLWTALDPAGEVWWALPRDQYGLSQKTAWYSRAFSVMKEPQPAITVRGRRLDIAGPTFTAGGPGTNAIDASGEWMLVGLSLPTPGCWE